MKSEYRQAVESVIAQEAKLAEVTRLYADAQAKEQQLARAVRTNRETMAHYEARVAELEPVNQSSLLLDLRSEMDSLKASVKMLCRESLRNEA